MRAYKAKRMLRGLSLNSTQETGRTPLRIRLSNFESIAVAQAMPAAGLYGTVVRRLTLTDWGDEWLLLQLESSFEFHGRPQQQVLIRSRLVDYDLARDAWTSTFLLLVPKPSVLDKATHTSQDFEHVSWATASTLPLS
jgi:hypothetical protein